MTRLCQELRLPELITPTALANVERYLQPNMNHERPGSKVAADEFVGPQIAETTALLQRLAARDADADDAVDEMRETWRQEHTAYHHWVDHLLADLAANEKEQRRQAHLANEAEARVLAMAQSNSWRLTAPLRALRPYMHKVRRELLLTPRVLEFSSTRTVKVGSGRLECAGQIGEVELRSHWWIPEGWVFLRFDNVENVHDLQVSLEVLVGTDTALSFRLSDGETNAKGTLLNLPQGIVRQRLRLEGGPGQFIYDRAILRRAHPIEVRRFARCAVNATRLSEWTGTI